MGELNVTTRGSVEITHLLVHSEGHRAPATESTRRLVLVDLLEWRHFKFIILCALARTVLLWEFCRFLGTTFYRAKPNNSNTGNVRITQH